MQTLLTPMFAARLIGVSTDSIRNYALSGRLRAIVDSEGNRLFREVDVLKFKAKYEAKRVSKQVTSSK